MVFISLECHFWRPFIPQEVLSSIFFTAEMTRISGTLSFDIATTVIDRSSITFSRATLSSGSPRVFKPSKPSTKSYITDQLDRSMSLKKKILDLKLNEEGSAVQNPCARRFPLLFCTNRQKNSYLLGL